MDQGETALEPVDLLAEAVREAEADAGVPGLAAAADVVAVVQIFSWRYRDPAALVAERIRARPSRTVATDAGGNHPQGLVNRFAREIQDGRADLVVIGGAESWRTRMGARARGEDLGWTRQPEGVRPTDVVGIDEALSHEAELARGLVMPVQHYPIFESAVRAAAGHAPAEHQRVISELWAAFSRVAADNPHAWIREPFTAEQIRTVGPDNRMVGYPYPKLMNSNNSVEQGAALILTSVERARSLGVPEDRWVFPWSGTGAHDTITVSHRTSLHRSPAIRHAGRAVLDAAGLGVDDLAHMDVYSCFPSAVQVAGHELGLELDRPLTVTGGLSFAGGPWNNYVTHSIATMAGRLRGGDEKGLITANGGYLTKHAFGVYSATPPPSGRFTGASVQDAVDAEGCVEVVDTWDGPVTVEGATVMHGRDGSPEIGFFATRLADGRRAWATTDDDDAMAVVTGEEPVGRPGHVGADGSFAFA